VVCGVWCVVCGVWCVVCGVWCVVCGFCVLYFICYIFFYLLYLFYLFFCCICFIVVVFLHLIFADGEYSFTSYRYRLPMACSRRTVPLLAAQFFCKMGVSNLKISPNIFIPLLFVDTIEISNSTFTLNSGSYGGAIWSGLYLRFVEIYDKIINFGTDSSTAEFGNGRILLKVLYLLFI
jgi:hypothetical protein